MYLLDEVVVVFGLLPLCAVGNKELAQPARVLGHGTHFGRKDNCHIQKCAFSIAPEELWGNSQETRIADILVRALSPKDILLFLCEHNSYGHLFNFGLRPYVDIGITIEFFDDRLDWNVIVERAIRWN